MFINGKLVLDVPPSWWEALLLGWTLVFCNLKARRVGHVVLISKEIY